MWLHEIRIERGNSYSFPSAPSARLPQMCAAFLASGSSVRVGSNFRVMVIALRGSVSVSGNSTHMKVESRCWMVCESDAQSDIVMSRNGHALVFGFTAAALRQISSSTEVELLTGGGRLDSETWRLLAQGLRSAGAPTTEFGKRETTIRALHRRISMLQMDMRACIAACPGISNSRKLQVMNRLQRARKYLEVNNDKVVSIKELAVLSSFSHWYFTKTFHRVYGVSPKAYSTRQRLERAKRLLNDQRVSVGDVAAACGFEDAGNFARAFRHYFGTSATACRRVARTA